MKRKSKHTRRRFKIWHGIVALLLLLLFVLFRITGSYKLKKRVQVLQSRGHPVTLEELDRLYNLPKGAQNAADVYLAAFSNYKKWDADAMRALPIAGKVLLPARTEPLDAPTRQLVNRFLSDNEQALSLLHKAASIEHCRYPNDFNDFALKSDPKTPLRDDVGVAAKLLGLEALVASDDKDADRLIDSIRVSLALARSIDGPLVTHRLTHGAVRGYTYRSIERAINRIPLMNNQLLMLSIWVKVSGTGDGYKRALLVEQCLGLQTFRTPIRDIANQIGHGKGMLLILAPWKMFGLCYKDTLTFIDLMQDSIDAMELPDPERLVVFNAVQEAVHNGGRGAMLTRMIWPAHAYTLHINIRHLAHLRATQTALTVEQYRLVEGHLPQSLDNLVPAYIEVVPTDPFDGRPLKYRTREKGYVVYSIGEDLTDEGGTELGSQGRDSRGKPLPCDITFIVER